MPIKYMILFFLFLSPSLAVTFNVSVFLFERLDTCIVGDACAGSECCNVEYAGGRVYKQFADNDRYKALKPGDQQIGDYPQNVCLSTSLNPAAMDLIKGEFDQFASRIEANTGGALGFKFNYILKQVNASMDKSGCGFYSISRPDLLGSIRNEVTKDTDFVFIIWDIYDQGRDMFLPFVYCGVSFSATSGIGGAGYVAIPKTTTFSFECVKAIEHEWLHQLDSVLYDLTHISDIYGQQREYPSCGKQPENTYLWFPSADDCQCDPDYVDCKDTVPVCSGSCSNLTAWDDHILSAHFNASWAGSLVTNFCRDGKMDFGEFGMDCGGPCFRACGNPVAVGKVSMNVSKLISNVFPLMISVRPVSMYFDISTCILSLGGLNYAMSGSGNGTDYTYVVNDIPDSYYNISILCADSDGNSGMGSTALIVDTIAPYIGEIRFNTTDKAKTNNAITIYARPVDATNVSSCSVGYNGMNRTMLGGGNGTLYNHTIPYLPNGEYVVYVYCSDSAGNIRSKGATLIVNAISLEQADEETKNLGNESVRNASDGEGMSSLVLAISVILFMVLLFVVLKFCPKRGRFGSDLPKALGEDGTQATYPMEPPINKW